MRSSLGTKRLKVDLANAEAALVQRVNGTVCPFGVERYRHREAIPHFVHETRPGSHMQRAWLLNAQPLGLQKRSPPPPPPRSQKPSRCSRSRRWWGRPAWKGCCSFGSGSARSRRRAGPWPACGADFTVGPGSCALAQAADRDALGATRTVGAEGGLGFCLPPSPPCPPSTGELFRLAHLQAAFLGVFRK